MMQPPIFNYIDSRTKMVNVKTAHAVSSTYVQLRHNNLLAADYYFAFENKHCTQFPPLGTSCMEEPVQVLQNVVGIFADFVQDIFLPV